MNTAVPSAKTVQRVNRIRLESVTSLKGRGTMPMKETELKPCPFCGGKAEIRRGKIYLMDTVQAHCTECGASMPKVPINHLLYTQGKAVRLTEEQAMQKTANEWNRRADNDE